MLQFPAATESSGAWAADRDDVAQAVWEHSECLVRASQAGRDELGRDKSADQERAAAPGPKAWDESAANALLNRVAGEQPGAPMADQPAPVVLPEGAAQWAPLVRDPSRDALGPHEAEWARPARTKFQAGPARHQALPGGLAAEATSVAPVTREQMATLKVQASALPV